CGPSHPNRFLSRTRRMAAVRIEPGVAQASRHHQRRTQDSGTGCDARKRRPSRAFHLHLECYPAGSRSTLTTRECGELTMNLEHEFTYVATLKPPVEIGAPLRYNRHVVH